MESIELVLQELKKINGRLDTLEGKVDKLQGDVTEIKADVDELRNDVAELKEAHEITRDGVNALLDWSDKISEAQRLPLPKI